MVLTMVYRLTHMSNRTWFLTLTFGMYFAEHDDSGNDVFPNQCVLLELAKKKVKQSSNTNYNDINVFLLTFWRRIFFSNFSTPCI
jgi:hypothetical protein